MPKRMIIDAKRYTTTLLPFFRCLAANKRGRDSFIRNPAAALQKAGLIGAHVDVSQTNRLVFSLITNKGFVKWAAAYQKKLPKSLAKGLRTGEAERVKLYEDCLSAMMKYADRELWVSLVGGLPKRDRQAVVAAGTQRIGGDDSDYVTVYNVLAAVVSVAVLVASAAVVAAAVFIGKADKPYAVDVAELLRIADVLAEAGVNKDLVTRATELRRSKKLADPRARFDK